MSSAAGDGPPGEETKLGTLLDRWPEAEAILRGLSPRFAALDDAVVRKAFTRAATLRQVAAAAGLQVAELLAALRAAGVPAAAPALEVPGAPGAAPTAAPAWAGEERVTAQRDARGDVAAGVHPLPLVLKDLEALGAGDVYALTTPFVPAPLIDLASAKGFEAWSPGPPAEGPVRTYFRRRPPNP